MNRLIASLTLAITAFGVLTLFVNCGAVDSNGEFSDSTDFAAERIAAAQTTATTNSTCTAIAPFYWEIGNASSLITSGSTGNGSVIRTTSMPIGSSTKWLFGAYALQFRGGAPQSADIPYLNMTSGYTNFSNSSCIGLTTVAACYSQGSNENLNSSNIGKFFYNGGHFQVWMNNVAGKGSLTLSGLATEFRSKLGTSVSVTFVSPQLAGGAYTSAAIYANFLRNIITGQLLMRNYLGANKVCTLPGSTGCNAADSPIPLEFHYSYGHWVEDDSSGDGSFSSAGVFGFYPWIDSTKRYYGIVARNQSYSGSDEIGNGYASYQCGKLIRTAYMTGVAQ